MKRATSKARNNFRKAFKQRYKIAFMQKRGSKFLNKKGTLALRQSLIHLGMIALLVVVYFLMDAYVNSIAQDTEFERIFLSRDIALLVNSLYSAPGNVEYIYSFDKLDLSKFEFELKDYSEINDIPVIEVKGYELIKTYPYAKNSPLKEINKVANSKEIKFSKSDSKITLAKNE